MPSVTNSLAANASAANVAGAATGLTVSTMTVVGGDGNYSISSGTNTAYGQGGFTPDIADIFTATIPRYHTFTLTLTDAYALESLAFETGGSNLAGGPATANFAYGAQVRIGSGSFTNLATTTGSLTVLAGNYHKTGDYLDNLDGTFANLDDTTVTFRIFLADDTGSGNTTGRIKNVVVNGMAVPEPSTLVLGSLGILGMLVRRRV